MEFAAYRPALANFEFTMRQPSLSLSSAKNSGPEQDGSSEQDITSVQDGSSTQDSSSAQDSRRSAVSGRQLPERRNPLLVESKTTCNLSSHMTSFLYPETCTKTIAFLDREQVERRGLTRTEELGSDRPFDYAYIRVPVPKGVKPSIRNPMPGIVLLKRRSIDGCISATGMFGAAFPYAEAHEEEAERKYVSSSETTDLKEFTIEVWVSPEAALRLAGEYGITLWIFALLDPAKIPVYNVPSFLLLRHGTVMAPPRFEVALPARFNLEERIPSSSTFDNPRNNSSSGLETFSDMTTAIDEAGRREDLSPPATPTAPSSSGSVAGLSTPTTGSVPLSAGGGGLERFDDMATAISEAGRSEGLPPPATPTATSRSTSVAGPPTPTTVSTPPASHVADPLTPTTTSTPTPAGDTGGLDTFSPMATAIDEAGRQEEDAPATTPTETSSSSSGGNDVESPLTPATISTPSALAVTVVTPPPWIAGLTTPSWSEQQQQQKQGWLTPASSSRAVRRRSSPRVRAPRHAVEDEEPPEDRFHDPAFQAALREAEDVVATLRDALGSSRDGLHLEDGSTIRQMYRRADELARFTCPATRTVGFVGDSGAGKLLLSPL